MTGPLGPGMGDLTYLTAGIPCVDAAGNVAFGARIAGPGVTAANDQGLWLGTLQGNQVMVRRGDPAVGFAQGVYGQFSLLALSRSGVLAFHAFVDGLSPNATVSGLWSNRTGVLAKAGESNNYPVLQENQFRGITRFYFGDAGLLTLVVTDDSGFSYPTQETPTAPPPRFPPGTLAVPTGTLESVEYGVNGAAVSESGGVLFSGRYRAPSNQVGAGLWTLHNGVMTEVALVSSPAPGGLVYCSFDERKAANEAGDLAFSAALGMPNQLPTTGALFHVRGGVVTRLVTTGDPAPGRPGVTLRGAGVRVMNRAGAVLFSSHTSTNASAELWRVSADGQVSGVVGHGQSLPGLPPGVTTSNLWDPSMNAAGEVALMVDVAGPGISSANNRVLVCIGAHGRMDVVARTGVPLTIAPGIVRTPTAIGFQSGGGGEDGRATGLSDSGVVAYRAIFSDGSYAVLTATVPRCGTADFNNDGDIGTDADIEAFFACLGGNCCETCYSGGADFNADGDIGTDADIESFFRVLGGGSC
ncbi:MAG TPA: choice-of-anchor tandem repeat NxxGxxAF-containing protein [Phycisphaerales bacterium]|nr:choice-of-anchor tandem repeat NxxGxxAF-containing protein [Phycisphaerales bacterium]